ncbi:hypothetical protein K7432_012849 [Basidiobolus ranarum]|uniref:Uncharacterized protein n=1 Tax=Basidiobolus ranarum TaxID=34480 RepID=A0ABR2VRN8_9FUNG
MRFKLGLSACFAALIVLTAKHVSAQPPRKLTITSGVHDTVTGLTSMLSHGAAVKTLARCNDGTVSCIPGKQHQYKKCTDGKWIIYECPWQKKPELIQYICVPDGNKAQCQYRQVATTIPTGIIQFTSKSVKTVAATSMKVNYETCDRSFKPKCADHLHFLSCVNGQIYEQTCTYGLVCIDNMPGIYPGCNSPIESGVFTLPTITNAECPWGAEQCFSREKGRFCNLQGKWEEFTCSEGSYCDNGSCILSVTANAGSAVKRTRFITHTHTTVVAEKTLSRKNTCPYDIACLESGYGRPYEECKMGEMVLYNCAANSICVNFENAITGQYGIECVLEIEGLQTPSPNAVSTRKLPTIDSPKSKTTTTTLPNSNSGSKPSVTSTQTPKCEKAACEKPGKSGVFFACINGSVKRLSCQNSQICIMTERGVTCIGSQLLISSNAHSDTPISTVFQMPSTKSYVKESTTTYVSPKIINTITSNSNKAKSNSQLSNKSTVTHNTSENNRTHQSLESSEKKDSLKPTETQESPTTTESHLYHNSSVTHQSQNSSHAHNSYQSSKIHDIERSTATHGTLNPIMTHNSHGSSQIHVTTRNTQKYDRSTLQSKERPNPHKSDMSHVTDNFTKTYNSDRSRATEDTQRSTEIQQAHTSTKTGDFIKSNQTLYRESRN